MPWLKHRLRDADVWAKVDDAGALVTDRDGRVEIVYKPADGAKVYRAGARNLAALPDGNPVEIVVGEPAPEKPKAEAKPATPATKPARGKTPPKPAGAGLNPDKVPHGAVEIWCDGACSGNPGPSGIGIVIIDIVVMWRGYKQLLARKLPKASTKGLFMYGAMRTTQIRRFRTPGPAVERGHKF